MTEALIRDITVKQGSRFRGAVHWYGAGKVIQEIEDLTVGCPTIITVTAHGLPSASKTPILIEGVKGARNANTGDNQSNSVLATYIDADTFSIEAHTRSQVYRAGTGCITWWQPTNLAGYTARMQIRERLDDLLPEVELTSVAGDIIIGATDARVTFTIKTSVTETLDFSQGVYDLEVVDPSDEATCILSGKVFLRQEVTR